MLEEDTWTQSERTKIEGFGKPLDIDEVGGGDLDWFECKGLPFGEWEKPSEWYACGETDPTNMAPPKQMFEKKRDEEAGALG